MTAVYVALSALGGFCAGLAVSALAHIVMRDLQNADRQ